MPVCPNCGEDNPDRARFCLVCGTALVSAPEPGEERKVVSVLFVDLVGFTARSHQADPEDVRATLRPYHALLKREIERFGGTVEKFIGDAVMAVFGAPVAHEDDAERAVRAALRVLEALPELNEQHPGMDLAVRAAVNTGEAVVALGARPERGEGIVTGDVVNTASRLQQEAPIGSVVVGEVTYRATGAVIDYEALEPVTVKGKAEPVPIWRAVGARSRYAVEVERPTTPFVGRRDDLAFLQQTYARTLHESSVQLVTVTGEPGVGKSRLIAEFFSWVDDRPELVFWRHGRCLPYGDGVTFWALGEIVKAQAGILESDGPDEAAAKLALAVESLVEDAAERDWLRARLAPLVGAAGDLREAVDRAESFAAWRSFLEAAASARPLVLVIEDLHWADAALLEFVDHLVDWATAVPILTICSARPELYERAPGWGGGKRNAATISLSPLSPEETARLISALLSEALLPAETQATLIDRAGGNPLYAEEFVRMLTERGILVRRGRAVEIAQDADVPVPETVQAIIAARLDLLPSERKALLQDASVVGKVFWSGALAHMGGSDEPEVREGLHELARAELVRPARRPTMEGQAEYAFWHVLIRDVSYGQIPRVARAARHRAAARWIEQVAGERVADHAELLAHHYEQALELSRAAGRAEEARELEEQARRFLVMAGDRALRLDVDRARSYYGRALELLPDDHPDRAHALVKAGEASWHSGEMGQAERYFEEAIEAFRATGDRLGVGDAMTRLSRVIWARGGTPRSLALLIEAVELLEGSPPGPELARAYVRMSGTFMLAARPRESLEWSEKALRTARRFGLESEASRAVQYRGIARCELGDLGGLDDIRESLRIALELGLGMETAISYNNLGDWVWLTEGPAPALDIQRTGIDFSRKRGLQGSALWTTAETTWMLFDLGEWDELLAVADGVLERVSERGMLMLIALSSKARVLVERGDVEGAASLADGYLPLAREVQDPQVLVPALEAAVRVQETLGRTPEALGLIEELDRATAGRSAWARTGWLPVALRALGAAGAVERAEPLLEGIDAVAARERWMLLAARAALAEASGELEHAASLHAEAAERWAEFGHALERGHALFGSGRCLVGLGKPNAATGALEEARKVFARLGARSLGEETETWLERATALTS